MTANDEVSIRRSIISLGRRLEGDSISLGTIEAALAQLGEDPPQA